MPRKGEGLSLSSLVLPFCHDRIGRDYTSP